MTAVQMFLLLVAGLFLLGALGEFIFRRTKIPDVIWMVGAGILLGPVFDIVPVEPITDLSPFFGVVALIIILFEGGSKMVLGEVAKATPRATVMGLFSFSASVGAAIGVGWLITATIDPEGSTPLATLSKHYTPLLGLLLGAIVGGSSGLIVMPSLSAAGMKGPAGRLLEMESSITDTLCIVLTSAIIGLLVTATADTGAEAAASGGDSVLLALKAVGRQFGLGILFGIMGAALWVPLLHILAGRSHAYTFTLSALFLLYVMVEGFNGNAAMGILVFAIVIGNAKNIAKLMKLPVTALNLEMDLSVKAIHTQLAFMIKSFFFTYIGLKLPTDPWLLGTGALLGLALLAVRLPAVQLGMLGAEYSPGDKTLIRICMPRGLAAGVLAAMPLEQGVPGTEAFVEIVFAAVVTSIVVFSVGFKWATRSTPTDGDGENVEADTNGDDPVNPATGFNPG